VNEDGTLFRLKMRFKGSVVGSFLMSGRSLLVSVLLLLMAAVFWFVGGWFRIELPTLFNLNSDEEFPRWALATIIQITDLFYAMAAPLAAISFALLLAQLALRIHLPGRKPVVGNDVEELLIEESPEFEDDFETAEHFESHEPEEIPAVEELVGEDGEVETAQSDTEAAGIDPVDETEDEEVEEVEDAEAIEEVEQAQVEEEAEPAEATPDQEPDERTEETTDEQPETDDETPAEEESAGQTAEDSPRRNNPNDKPLSNVVSAKQLRKKTRRRKKHEAEAAAAELAEPVRKGRRQNFSRAKGDKTRRVIHIDTEAS
jgi:hypothetical protein